MTPNILAVMLVGFWGKCMWSKNSRRAEWMHYSVERVVCTLSDQSTHGKRLRCLKTLKTITQSHVRCEKAWLSLLKHTGRCYLISFMQWHGICPSPDHQTAKPTQRKEYSRRIFTHRLRNVSWSDTIKPWHCSRLHLKNRYFIPKTFLMCISFCRTSWK